MWQTMNFKFEVQTFPSEDLHQWNTEYHIAGSFRGRKVLQTSRFCSYYISLRNLEAWRLFERQKRATAKVFSTKIVFFHQSAKVFSLEIFPLYGDTTELWYDDYVMCALIIRVDILSSIVP